MNKTRQLTFLETLYNLNSTDSSVKSSAYNEFCAAAYHYAITVMTALQYNESELLYRLACSAEDLACEFAMILINNKEKLLKVYDSSLSLGEEEAEINLKAYIKKLKQNFLISKYRKVSHQVEITTIDKATGKETKKKIWVYDFLNISSLSCPVFENTDNTRCETMADVIMDPSIDYDYSYLATREVAERLLGILSAKEQFAFIKDMLGLKNSYLSKEIEQFGYVDTYKKMLLQFANSPLLKGDDSIVEYYYDKYTSDDFETSLSPSRFISKYSSIYKNNLTKNFGKEILIK